MFVKNDESFLCLNCNKKVEKLKYTSRDHCNFCLYSIHVDITPGDRKNTCLGILMPYNIEKNGKKEQIVYMCKKCGRIVKNVVAEDDDRNVIYEIIKKYAENGGK